MQFVLLLLIGLTVAQWTQTYTYMPITSACVPILNISHQLGCSTASYRVHSKLRSAVTAKELQLLLQGPHQYATSVVLDGSLLNRQTIDNLQDSLENKFIGIFVLRNQSIYQFSPESIKLQTFRQWNPHGNGIIYEKLDFGMVMVENSDDQEILIRHARYNEDKLEQDKYPPFSSQITSVSPARESSKSCLSKCGQSIWGVMNSTKIDKNRKMIFLSSAMDSRSLFPYDYAVGAESDMSGLVVLLGALKFLSQVNLDSLTHQIAFAIFDGESFGYIGSDRFAHDITNFVCKKYTNSKSSCSLPLRYSFDFRDFLTENIDVHISLVQLGIHENEKSYEIFMHYENDEVLDTFNTTISEVQENSSRILLHTVKGIPPESSALSFQKYNGSIPTVVLADFNDSFKNRFYHSYLDTSTQVNIQKLCESALLAARFVYEAAGGDNSSFNNISCEENMIIPQLFDCLAVNLSSSLCTDLLQSLGLASDDLTKHLVGSKLSHFPGVFSPLITPEKEEKGLRHLVYTYIKNLTDTVLYHPAYDSGIERTSASSYDYKIVDESRPIWTINKVASFEFRVFQEDSWKSQLVFLICSCALFLLLHLSIKRVVPYYARKFRM